MKNWKKWAHDLIPCNGINPEYVKKQWETVCVEKPNFHPSGLACDIARRVAAKKRPNDKTTEEFYRELLSETYLTFMKRYFSSFRKPMKTWLAKLTLSTAQDCVKRWIPGGRFPKTVKKPKVVSIDEPTQTQEGEEGEPLAQNLAEEQLPGKRAVKPENKILTDEVRKIHMSMGKKGKLSDDVIDWHFFHDYPDTEIAEFFGLSVNTIRSARRHDCQEYKKIATERRRGGARA